MTLSTPEQSPSAKSGNGIGVTTDEAGDSTGAATVGVESGETTGSDTATGAELCGEKGMDTDLASQYPSPSPQKPHLEQQSAGLEQRPLATAPSPQYIVLVVVAGCCVAFIPEDSGADGVETGATGMTVVLSSQ